MGEELGAVRVNAVQTFVEAVLGRHGEILVEQLIHRAGQKPVAVQMPFAAGRDELADGEQFEDFEPRHLGFALGQAIAPEGAQVQFIPQATGQPAIAKGARMMERQFGEFDLESVEDLGWDLAVFGEEADLFGELGGFIEGVETFAPGGLPREIEVSTSREFAQSLSHGACCVSLISPR